ncbi:MAG TPA: PIN domain-containing protein [Thermoanaerobaculia bacterium]|nr:PIN domain-containing protein [Thermoanaerobaculia bacterium]
MVVVDTSVWIAAFRQRDSKEATALRGLLDSDRVALAAPVQVELLSGASLADLPRLKRVLSALPFWQPQRATWRRIEEWIELVTAEGERFGFADLLIAALAAEREASVWSLDKAFVRMDRLGLVRVHATT